MAKGKEINRQKNFKISKPKIEKQTSKKKPKMVQKNTLLSYYSFKHKIKTDSSENSASIQEKHKLVQVKTNVDLKKSRPDSEMIPVTKTRNTASNKNKNEVPDGATSHTKPSLPHGTTTVDKKEKFLKLQSCSEDPVTWRKKTEAREDDPLLFMTIFFILDKS